ncbi:MAG: hypothetical protein ACLP59_25225 [Bryobacteraceae bacterium]
MPLTLKAINAELANRGHAARLEKSGDYFYFLGGEADDWLDRTVQVPKVSSLTLDQWIAEFGKLKKRNVEIFRAAKAKKAGRVRK